MTDDVVTDDVVTADVRRAPFSGAQRIGARGEQSRQRILDGALRAFGEVGYHRCGVARITEAAGCSRAAFYQYFSSREDVFRHLAAQVARQLMASAEALGPITADEAGWETVRVWVERHGDVYRRYEPVFRAAHAAAENDDAIATGSVSARDRTAALIRSKVAATSIPARHLDAVVGLLLETMSRTHYVADVIGNARRGGVVERSRVDDALADVVHRVLAGFDPAVNVHGSAVSPPRRATTPRVMTAPVDPPPLSRRGVATRAALLVAGRDVLLNRGYHATRVDDVVAVAGVSHGAFYRYFGDKDHLVRRLASDASRSVASALGAIPVPSTGGTANGSAALRRWLRTYNTTYAAEAAMFRVWVDATADHPEFGVETATALDWGRRQMGAFLEQRGFGDVDAEAIVMVALLDAFAVRRGDSSTVDAALRIIERGLLGRA